MAAVAGRSRTGETAKKNMAKAKIKYRRKMNSSNPMSAAMKPKRDCCWLSFRALTR